MKKQNKTAIALVVAMLVIGSALGVSAVTAADRIRTKFKRVQAAVTVSGRKRIRLDGVLQQIVDFKKALEKGDAVTAEKLLDTILARKELVPLQAEIAREPAASNKFNPPYQTSDEPIDNTWSVPRPIEIAGYDDNAMEPCITLDGKYLMFNNSNDAAVKTHIHLCERLDKNHFRYIGTLPGTVSGSKDMAPSVDKAGNIYYTCLKTYDQDLKSLYVGRFASEAVQNVEEVAGDISPNVQTWINMDCCVSADGNSLVVSRARFAFGSVVPSESDLLLFFKDKNNIFSPHPDSGNIMKAVNSPALEYAPSLSADQTEIYFTRAQKDIDSHTLMRILVAKRKNTSEPFGPPSALGIITGFVEAPTLSEQNNEMFYHKLDGDKFRIYRCERAR
jgi:hypothetical protein